MSGRILLSRPRTRIYDANYNIGENYYKPTLDNLGRKNRRSASPVRSSNLFNQRENRTPNDFLSGIDGFEGNFESASSRRAAAERSTAISEEFDREASDLLDRVRRRKKPVTFDDEEPVTISKRLSQTLSISRDRGEGSALRVTNQDSDGLLKWTPLPSQEEDESKAMLRRNKLRNKIMEIENDMIDRSERQATRDKRTARLKAILAESTEETAAAQSVIESGFRRLEIDN